MTGMGFDGLVVNHGGMREITGTLRTLVSTIRGRMDDLESDLTPLQGEWSGSAKDAYQRAKLRWDTAIAEMLQLLDEAGRTVEASQGEYAAADLRGARAFEIGG